MLAMPTPSDLQPALGHGGPLAHGARLWPGLRHRGSKGQPGFITLREREVACVFWLREGFQGPWTPGTCGRVSETVARRSPPLPSQTGSGGETCAGSQTEARVRVLDDPCHHLVERTGVCLARRDGPWLCVRRQRWGAAAAGGLLETRRPIVCPWPEPGRDGVALNLGDRGEGLARPPVGTA